MNQLCLCRENYAEVLTIYNNKSTFLCTNCYLTIRGKKGKPSLRWWLKLTKKEKMNMLNGTNIPKNLLLPKDQFFKNLTFGSWRMVEEIYLNKKGDIGE